MKSKKDFRIREESADTYKKAVKLDPIRKSGKERHAIYKTIDEEDEDIDLKSYYKKESTLDYMGDEEGGETPEQWEDGEEFDDEEEGYDDEVEEQS